MVDLTMSVQNQFIILLLVLCTTTVILFYYSLFDLKWNKHVQWTVII